MPIFTAIATAALASVAVTSTHAGESLEHPADLPPDDVDATDDAEPEA